MKKIFVLTLVCLGLAAYAVSSAAFAATNCPSFPMPTYDGNTPWNWASLSWVSCTAQDSQGNFYPAAENAFGTISYSMSQTRLAEDAAFALCTYKTQTTGACCLVQSCTPYY